MDVAWGNQHVKLLLLCQLGDLGSITFLTDMG
jgi:hypothetical protein